MSAITTQAALGRKEVTTLIVTAVAEVMCMTSEEVLAHSVDGGEGIVLSAKEAMATAAIVEDKLGRGALFSAVDFGTNTTTGASEGRVSRFSSSGCIDPGEETTIDHLVDITLSKLS